MDSQRRVELMTESVSKKEMPVSSAECSADDTGISAFESNDG
jgi:hypothetical protein